MSHFVIGGFQTEEWFFWNRLSCVCVSGEEVVQKRLYAAFLAHPLVISLFSPLFFDAYVATDDTFLDPRHVLGLV